MIVVGVVQKIVSPIVCGSTPGIGFEIAAEMVLARKSQLPTNLFDRKVGIEQQAGGSFHFEVVEVAHGGHVHVPLKKADEVFLRDLELVARFSVRSVKTCDSVESPAPAPHEG